MRRPHLRLLGRRYREHDDLSAQPSKGPQVLHVVGHVRVLYVPRWHMRAQTCVGDSTEECAHRHCSTNLHEHWRSRRLHRRPSSRIARVSSNAPEARLEQASWQDAYRLLRPSPHRTLTDHRLHHPVLLYSQHFSQDRRPLDSTERNPLHAALQRRVSDLAAAVTAATARDGQRKLWHRKHGLEIDRSGSGIFLHRFHSRVPDWDGLVGTTAGLESGLV